MRLRVQLAAEGTQADVVEARFPPVLDRFLAEQLAGDEMVDWRSAEKFTPDKRRLLVATGFIRSAPDDTDENELNTLDLRYATLHHTGEMLAKNLLAQTLACAKCHNHKYEAIPQRDYYRFMAFFQPALNPKSWLQPHNRRLAGIAPAEKAKLDRELAELEMRRQALRGPVREKLALVKAKELPEPARAGVLAALGLEASKRNDAQKKLLDAHRLRLEVSVAEIKAALALRQREEDAKVTGRMDEILEQLRSAGVLHALYDVGPPPPTHLLYRGDYLHPMEEIQPGFFAVLCDSESASLLADGKPVNQSSGRRLALARWLTDWDSPAGALVARVYVNRVWQHLFGRGVVATAENFGVSGTPPTHPELLEWLAAEFVAQGRRTKPLVRQLVLSSAYRQVSTTGDFNRTGREADPANDLLWRMRLRRLESEIIRDCILTAAGKLDRTMGGPSLMLKMLPDGRFVVQEEGLPTPTAKFRRSVYVLARRNYHLSMFEVFDQPRLTESCVRREPSAVVLQSLSMLNDEFVQEQAAFVGEQIGRAADDGHAEKIAKAAFQLVLCRPPRARETAWVVEFISAQRDDYEKRGAAPAEARKQAVADLAHMLLNTSEFLYNQ